MYERNPVGIGSKVNIYGWLNKPIEERKIVTEIFERYEDKYKMEVKKLKSKLGSNIVHELKLNNINWLL
ncbi:MAG: hypothetical protein PHN69_05870 [Candidatus Pacebacteria bacterium]|nr:hypothetical protein [Candidatus Paceibacterota bacterium]